MRIVAALCLVLVNAGALLLLAPTTGNRVYEAIGLDPAYREFGGWVLFTGGQVFLLVVVNVITEFLQTADRVYCTIKKSYDHVVGQKEALIASASLCAEEPKRLATRVMRLRQKLRKALDVKREAEQRRHRLEIQVAELKKFRSYLDDADDYDDSDDRRNEVLLREVAQLRERMEYMVDPASHQEQLAQYYELKGRLAEREKHPALCGGVNSDSALINTDQAVS